MAVQYRTRGLVFKKEDRREADRIFSVFTQDFGRVEILAKAVRKITSKLRGGIDIFSLSDLEFIQGKNRKTLTDAVSVEKFNTIIEVPEKFEVALRICEVLEHFIKGQEPDEALWQIITDIFTNLNNPDSNSRFLYYYFFWNFVAILGHKPQLFTCVICNQALRPEILYFSNKEGGVVCKKCIGVKKDGTEITPDVIKILRLILKKDWETLSLLKIEIRAKKLLKEISNNYYHYLTDSYSNRSYE